MAPPDPEGRDRDSRGSSYYPDESPETQEYSASDYEAQRRTDAQRQAEREEAHRRAEHEAAERERKRIIAARILHTIIQVVCYLFAVVLAIHIVLVIGDANEGNGFYQFIDGWANGVALGFNDLFVPENLKFRTALNEGLAAIVWIIIGIVLSTLVRRLLMPVPRSHQNW